MQRKMQETATDLTDNLYCVHIFNMFCELTLPRHWTLPPWMHGQYSFNGRAWL